MKKQNGITLIALVITIIVLLLLAGVTISLVVGDNGILTQATKAVKENKSATAREEVAMAWTSVESDYWTAWTKDTSVTKYEYFKEEKLNEYLLKKGEIVKDTLDLTYNPDGPNTFEYVRYENPEITYTVTITEKRKIQVEEKDNQINGGEGDTNPENPDEGEQEIIPEGGTYYVGVTSTQPGMYTGATATYQAGDAFPEVVNVGDVYVYGDYEYRYNQHITKEIYETMGLLGEIEQASRFVWSVAEQEGWGVRVLDSSKETQGKILEIINGMPITNLNYTLASLGAESAIVWDESDLKFLEDGFTIPNSVTNVEGMFYYCDKIISLPESFIIPNSVTNMKDMFYYAESLTGKIIINATPISYTSCFRYCKMSKISIEGDCEIKGSLIATGN